MKWRGKTIARLEEAFKIGAIEGCQYNALHCCVPDHPARHGKIYTPDEARKLIFGSDCHCDLLPYNSRWGNELQPYSEPIGVKRARIQKDYERFFQRDDLASLISLEELYRQDLQWHWANLRDFSVKLMKAGDLHRALTWINSSINERMKQQVNNKIATQNDSSLAWLFASKGLIYMRSNNFIAALGEFLIALWQYEWKPTKVLTTRVNKSLKSSGITQASFNEVIDIAKKEGIQKGLSYLSSLTLQQPNV